MNWFQKYLDTKIENDLKKLIELQYNNQTEQSHG
jgi:hypothetical protein